MQKMDETQVRSLGQEDPWRRSWQPVPVFLSGKSHRQKSLAGYSPWGHRVRQDWSDSMDAHTRLSLTPHLLLLVVSWLSLYSLSKASHCKAVSGEHIQLAALFDPTGDLPPVPVLMPPFPADFCREGLRTAILSTDSLLWCGHRQIQFMLHDYCLIL